MAFKNRRQFLFAAIGGGGALGWAWTCGQARPEATAREDSSSAGMSRLQLARRSSHALGTTVSVAVLAEDAKVAGQAADAALLEVVKVDRLMSLYRADSQLARLNLKGAIDKPHPYLVEVLRQAEAMSRRSDGAFDVTVQPLWSAFAEAGKMGALPEASTLESARRLVGWQRVQCGSDRIQLSGSGTAVTLNGIAQGFAADRVVEVLRRHGIRHALVNTGEISTLGRRADGNPWTVGIQDPRREDVYLGLTRLQGRCLSTSGDYATCFSPDRQHNHLFDPHTGRSPQAFSSVSIVAPTATEADALSTTVFVLGPEKGLKLVRSTPGADALLVFKNGKTLATAGFPSMVQEKVAS